eukprot:1186788-Prorocentrum_minimum.AAC.1
MGVSQVRPPQAGTSGDVRAGAEAGPPAGGGFACLRVAQATNRIVQDLAAMADHAYDKVNFLKQGAPVYA